MNIKSIVENHKVWLVVGGLATAAGLVIAWKQYQAQQAGNQQAADAASQTGQEDSLLASLLQTPLSGGSAASGTASTTSTDTGNSAFQELLATLLSSGNSSGSTGTGSGDTTGAGGSGGSGNGTGSTGNVYTPAGSGGVTTTGNKPIATPVKPTKPVSQLRPFSSVAQ